MEKLQNWMAENMMAGSKNPYPIQKITRLLGVCLLIGVIVYFLTKNVAHISITVQEDHMSLSYSAGDTMTIRYGDILSITEAQDLDLGINISGTQTQSYWVGVWENNELGEYNLCIYANVARYIVVETSNDVFVFNLESEDATSSFYKAFKEMIESE